MAKLQYLYSSEFTQSNFTPAHNHPYYELIYYCRGQGKSNYSPVASPAMQEIDFSPKSMTKKELLTFSDNTFMIMPPNISHDEQTNGSASVISIGFIPDEDFKKEISDFTLVTISDPDLSVFKYIKLIKKEFYEKKYRYKSMLDCLTHELLIHLLRRKKDKIVGSGMDYVIRYINEYYMTDINVSELAQKHGFSPSHFRILFKERVNLSPKQYILQKRLEKIKEDLATTSIPLSQIAYDNGFSDYYQFSTFFKKKTGVTPKEYRNNAQCKK